MSLCYIRIGVGSDWWRVQSPRRLVELEGPRGKDKVTLEVNKTD